VGLVFGGVEISIIVVALTQKGRGRADSVATLRREEYRCVAFAPAMMA
jgi:hypothetical protein